MGLFMTLSINDTQHKWHSAQTLSKTVLSTIMMSVAIFYCYAASRYAKFRYTECRQAECCYAECLGAPRLSLWVYIDLYNKESK